MSLHRMISGLAIGMLWLGASYSAASVDIGRNDDGRITRVSASAGAMAFEYTQLTGMKLSVCGTPFITSSGLFVVSPGWLEKYFLSTSEAFIADVEVEPLPDGLKIVLIQQSAYDTTGAFSGRQTFTLFDDNTISIAFDVGYDGDGPALFESKVGGINPQVIAGRPFTVQTGQRKRAGVIPQTPVGRTPEACMVARNFDRLTIDSRIGVIEIECDADDRASFFDYRDNIWAEASEPLFWFGYIERPIAADRRIQYGITIRFRDLEAVKSRRGGRVEAVVPTQQIDDARVATWGQDVIVPTPQAVTYNDARFRVNSDTLLYFADGRTPLLDNGAAFVQDEWEQRFDVRLKIASDDATQDQSGAIVICDPDTFAQKTGFDVPEHHEGYGLRVDDTGVLLSGRTETGAFWGLMTLLQLAEYDEQGLRLRGASIADYPAMDVRGLHFFSGRDAADQIIKTLRTLMARFKINTLLWQCEYINWDCCPNIHHSGYGMSKADARRVLETARRYNIEIIPLIPSLGHQEWMFANNQNLELAEDPDLPYAHCVTDERSYDFLFRLYDEVVAFFDPRYLHIGHDEVAIVGRFPYRSLSAGKTATELVAENINRLHTWLSERDIKTMIWGDMFLHISEASSSAHAPSAQEAAQRRKLLPDDIIICDWHYENNPPEAFVSLNLFQAEGFDVIGSTWYKHDNISGMANAAAENELMGLIHTTWAGYSFEVDRNRRSWYQYWAYIWAAHYAWTGDHTREADLPFSAAGMFHDLWHDKTPLRKNQKGTLLDMGRVCNRSLTQADILGALSGIPSGHAAIGDTTYLLGDRQYVLMEGNLNPEGTFPDALTLQFDPVKARGVHFLMTTAFAVKDGDPVATLTFHYTDGKTATEPVVYGQNIFAFTDERVGRPDTNVAWRTASPSGTACLHAYRWVNPSPDRQLRAIEIKSTNRTASLALFGITAIQ